MFQLVSGKDVGLLRPQAKKDDQLFYEQDVIDEQGVAPAVFPWWIALRGDSSDNLPGIGGRIWGKHISAVIEGARSYDDILRRVATRFPEKWDLFEDFQTTAKQNYRLCNLRDPEVKPEGLEQHYDPNLEAVKAFCLRLEMRFGHTDELNILQEGTENEPV